MPKGRHPKPANMRQNRTKKTGAATLPPMEELDFPDLPNPDDREFHPLTLSWWQRVWSSPMAGEYIPTDVDGLARVAILVDNFNKKPDSKVLAEIRLQESRFGLSPLDRSRLQWEVAKGEEAERKRKPQQSTQNEMTGADPRGILGVVK